MMIEEPTLPEAISEFFNDELQIQLKQDWLKHLVDYISINKVF